MPRSRRGGERGRLKIEWIVDEKKRKKTLSRRLPVVLKKAEELATLCDVPVSLVAYCPGEAEPVVWPSPGAAADVVRTYRDLPELDRSKNKMESTDFVKKTNDKVTAKLSKLREGAIKNVITDFVDGRRDSLNDLHIDFFISVAMKVNHRLQAIRARLKEIRPAPPLLPPLGSLLQHYGPTPTPMTLDGEPRYGSYMFEVLDAINHSGDGSALPSTEEMHAVFLQARTFSPPLP